MTPRQERISRLVIGPMYIGFGIWSLVDGDVGKCAFWLVLGAVWLLMASLGGRLTVFRRRRRTGG